MLLMMGGALVFKVLIPLGCLMIVIYLYTHADFLKSISFKLISLGLVLILLVPTSVWISQTVEKTLGNENVITEIEEHGPEKLVLFAGYGGIDVDDKDNLMKGFIDSNPGLKSRINSTIFFKSYTPDEMVEIVHILARTQQFSLTKSADEDLRAYFAERVRDRNFGNGREARSLLQNATIFAAKRTRDIKAVRSARNRLQAITASDIRQAIQRQRRSTAMQNGRQSAGGFGFMV
jgi:hypothetical protein